MWLCVELPGVRIVAGDTNRSSSLASTRPDMCTLWTPAQGGPILARRVHHHTAPRTPARSPGQRPAIHCQKSGINASRTRPPTTDAVSTPDEASLHQNRCNSSFVNRVRFLDPVHTVCHPRHPNPHPFSAATTRRPGTTTPAHSRRSIEGDTMWFKALSSALCLAATALGAVGFDSDGNENIRSISVSTTRP